MNKFKQYRRKAIAELRNVTEQEVTDGVQGLEANSISISAADIDNGSPRIGDKVARNSLNHNDQWLVAEDYFNDNFEEINND